MEATLKSMRPNLYDEYIRLLNKMSEKQNVILDFGNTIDAAFYYSDALITDYSSLMFKYFPTKKPIFNFSINPKYYNL
jgi:CDP-glycerol glycerophosphotransferase (TagB/SpsB family)